MSKLLCMIFVVVSCLLTFTSALADEMPMVTVYVDGEQIMFDVEPIIDNGRTLVPLRYIFEALDAEVDWISDTSTAVAVKDDIKIEISINDNKMFKNGEIIELDVPAKLISGRTLVPVRAVSEGLGALVEWDPVAYRVDITSVQKTEDNTKNGDAVYSYAELSPEDKKILHSVYGQMRYEIEQREIPQLVFSYPQETVDLIESENEGFAAAFCESWDESLIMSVVDIQTESESEYEVAIINPENENEFKDTYLSLLRELGYSSDKAVEFSFTKTPKGKKLLLADFAEVVKDENYPLLITSKYLAIVVHNNDVRYFTLEYSPIFDVYMLCEVKADSRANFGQTPATVEDFLSGIDSACDGK